jgi:hypothetical protein
MTKTHKTNPQYAAIAYRRTLLHNVITYLKRNYVGLDSDPKDQLICEEVFHVDRVVPPEEIDEFIEELENEEESLRLELGRFEFTRKSDEQRKNKTQRGKKRGN